MRYFINAHHYIYILNSDNDVVSEEIFGKTRLGCSQGDNSSCEAVEGSRCMQDGSDSWFCACDYGTPFSAAQRRCDSTAPGLI